MKTHMRTRRTFEILENILLATSAAVILLSLVMLGAVSMNVLAAEPTGDGQKVVIIGTGVDSSVYPLVYEGCFSTDNIFQNSTCPDGTVEQIGPGAGAPFALTPAGLHDTRVAAVVLEHAPDAQLIAFQTYSVHSTRGTFAVFHSNTVRALEHTLTLAEQDPTIAAVILAQGGSAIYSDPSICDFNYPSIESIGASLEALGVAFVASAGNTTSDVGIVGPAVCNNVVSAGATLTDDTIWEFASHGPLMDIFANGETLYGGVPFVGSSYSSPRVAATFARQKENNAELTVAQNLAAMQRFGVAIPTSYGSKPRLAVGPDTDADGVSALFDNCLDVANPAQVDPDGDGYGVRCDPDVNNDTGVNFTDVGICRYFWLQDPEAEFLDVTEPDGTFLYRVYAVDCDFDQDGAVLQSDLQIITQYFYGPPGPSGLVPDPVY